MQDLWRLLSSPRHVIVFEAAARHGSFTRAAEELNVRQPAVSASIKQLEASLGVTLFQREHKKVSLTAAGHRLFADVSRALDTLLTTAQAVQQLGQGRQVTLNASSAFNFYWMMPKLRDLHEAHPEIDLRLQSSDREPHIDAENIDLAVRRGSGDWPGCDVVLLAKEVIYPVASPAVMNAATNLTSISDLRRQRLIHLEEPIRERPTWKQWFAHFGVPGSDPASGLRLNDYALVLQAAIAGEGFAFGWHHVTAKLVSQGLLASRTDWSWETGLGFYLIWSKSKTLTEQARHVRNWLINLTEA